MQHLEVLVEDRSMEAAFELLLPKILGSLTFKLHPHNGKQDLLKKLPNKLRGYARWLPASHRIIVVADRDGEDCRRLKGKLDEVARVARLATKTAAGGSPIRLVNRLAIEELEAWFFGDWVAVKAAYPRVSSRVPAQANYRYPDNIKGGTWEALERVLKKAKYFKTGLRKIELARAVAEQMEPSRNDSPSFQSLRTTLVEMAGMATPRNN